MWQRHIPPDGSAVFVHGWIPPDHWLEAVVQGMTLAIQAALVIAVIAIAYATVRDIRKGE